MGDKPEEEEVIELSDEMLEAIRILRSDGHTRELKDLKESHAEILRRLDARNEAKEEKTAEPPKDTDSGNKGNDIPSGSSLLPTPEPPPKIEPPVEPPKTGRKRWWESENYTA